MPDTEVSSSALGFFGTTPIINHNFSTQHEASLCAQHSMETLMTLFEAMSIQSHVSLLNDCPVHLNMAIPLPEHEAKPK